MNLYIAFVYTVQIYYLFIIIRAIKQNITQKSANL